MPLIHLATPGKPELLESFERRCCFDEINLGLYRNVRLRFPAQSKCNKTSSLGFSQNRTLSFGIHVGSLLIRAKQQYGRCSDNEQTQQQ
jgi:hypothetical protein